MDGIKTPKIVLDCGRNFTSLRIEDPKKVSPERENNQIPRYILQSIPELSKHFILKEKIGEGTFSKVYKAKLIKDPTKEYALKCIVPTLRWDRVADELRYLRDLGGDSNIVAVKTCLFGHGFTAIVMPYFKHDRFQDLLKDITGPEIRDYMKNLFIALDKVHKNGIIHRDIKPSNFLYNRRLKQYSLVDFGLAQDEKSLRKLTLTTQAHLISHLIPSSKTHGSRSVLKDLTKTNSNFALLTKDSTTNPMMIKKRSFDAMTTSPQDNGNAKKIKVDANGTPGGIAGEGPQTVIPETPPKSCKEANRPEMKIPKSLPLRKSALTAPCACYGKDQVCNNCLRRCDLAAPRAGTPGFRAPEVLLKHLTQTTAIDIWSAGVIMASLLSRRYPFFRNIDDLTAMAEIITVLGTKRVIKAAKELNRTISLYPKKKPPLDLKILCEKLRGPNEMVIDDSAYDLLNRLLEPSPKKRLTAAEALRHPFIVSRS